MANQAAQQPSYAGATNSSRQPIVSVSRISVSAIWTNPRLGFSEWTATSVSTFPASFNVGWVIIEGFVWWVSWRERFIQANVKKNHYWSRIRSQGHQWYYLHQLRLRTSHRSVPSHVLQNRQQTRLLQLKSRLRKQIQLRYKPIFDKSSLNC